MNELHELRLRGVRVLALLGSAIAAIAIVWGFWSGSPVQAIGAVSVIMVPAWFAFNGRNDVVARVSLGIALPLQAALLLALAAGTRWQLDFHMLFFAVMAVLAIVADWRVILAGTITTAVHHLLLNFVAPVYVFPDGEDFARVMFHAVIVLLEAGVLAYLCTQLESLLAGLAQARATQAAAEAERAAEREKVSAEQRMVLDKLSDRLKLLAGGDLAAEIVAPFPGEYDAARIMLNDAARSLRDTLANVMEGMESMTSGSSEIRYASDDLARRTEEQAANLEETAAAIAQISASVQESAATGQKANTTIAETKTRANNGAMVAAEAVQAMKQIEASSSQISNVIAVIESISFQTNLLALNAGVEAARAGTAGSGFAVVASEVRALAQRCADAAEEVKSLVSLSGQHVGSGVELVTRSGEAFDAIARDVSELSQAIQMIATATAQQASNLAQINTVVIELDRSTQQNAAMAEECTAAANSLASEAQLVHQGLTHFQVGEKSPQSSKGRSLRRVA